MRILVADDDRNVADAMAAYLEARGHSVTTTYDGLAACVLALEAEHDAAVLDINMPGMDGNIVARCIRAGSWCTPIRLIAVTGEAQPIAREEALRAGFDHFVLKPAPPDHILALLTH